MTDKTQYCELCEAAQREIARLEAERFTMIDEAIKIAHRGANNNLNGMEGADAAEFHDCETRYCCYTDIEHWLKEIRAKYEKGE